MATAPPMMPQGNAAPMVEGQPMPSYGEDGGEGQGFSAEEQAEYEDFVTRANDLIHGGEKAEVMPEILESLGRGRAKVEAPEGGEAPTNGPILALANTAVQIIQKLDVDAMEAGKPWSDDVLQQGATEVIGMLDEVAEAAGIYVYSEEDVNGAYFQAVDLYRPIAIEMGRTTDETLKGQFAEIVEADKAGRLSDVLPGAGTATGEPPMEPAVEQ